MPCRCDYMDPTDREIQISRVACLLDELDGKSWNKDQWGGFHSRVYCNYSKQLGDELVSELCSKLKELDVTQYSLEMQMWWRDHQLADKKRIESQS